MKRHSFKLVSATLLVFLFAICESTVHPQNSTPSPTALPSPQSTPLEGKTELTDVKIEPTILGYRAVDEVAAKIAKSVGGEANKLNANRLFILDRQESSNLDNYLIVKHDVDDQLSRLISRYNEVVQSYCAVFVCEGANNNSKKIFLFTVADTSLLSVRQSLQRLKLLLERLKTVPSGAQSERDILGSELKIAIDQLNLSVRNFEAETGRDLPQNIKNDLSESIETANELQSLASKQNTSQGKFFSARIANAPLLSISDVNKLDNLDRKLGGVGAAIDNFAYSSLSPAITTIGFASDLLALFHSNVAITGVDITPDNDALISAIRGYLPATTEVYNTAEFFPAANPTSMSSGLVTKIQLLRKARTDAESQVFIGRIQIQAAVDDLNREKDDVTRQLDLIDKYILDLEGARAKEDKLDAIKAIQKEIEKYSIRRNTIEAQLAPIVRDLSILGIAKNHVDALVSLNSEADQFVSGLLSPTGTDESRAVVYVRAERLGQILSDNKPYLILNVGISAVGGNDRTTTNLWRYFVGSKLDFSGGAVGYWKLFDPAGKMVGGSIIRSYTGYIDQDDVGSDIDSTGDKPSKGSSAKKR